MDVFEAIHRRRSIRRFQDRPLSPEVINQLADALLWAPSAGNLQSRKFYFVTNPEARALLSKAAWDQKYITQAQLLVIGCTDDEIQWKYGDRGKDLFSVCDVANSIQGMMLLATELGLGTVWVGAFEDDKVRDILQIPVNLKPIAIIPVGYPNENPDAPPRVSQAQAIQRIE